MLETVIRVSKLMLINAGLECLKISVKKVTSLGYQLGYLQSFVCQ